MKSIHQTLGKVSLLLSLTVLTTVLSAGEVCADADMCSAGRCLWPTNLRWCGSVPAQFEFSLVFREQDPQTYSKSKTIRTKIALFCDKSLL